jgi:hypothetical protein
VRDWLATQNIETAFIEPGSPWENAYSESFNSRFRDELLDREIFTSLLEARTLIEQHRRDYNERRPHSSLGYKTPKTFAREHQAMESAGMWKAAEKRAFPHALENAPHPPPAFPTATTASATGKKKPESDEESDFHHQPDSHIAWHENRGSEGVTPAYLLLTCKV